MRVRASAPGKVILFGEHSVVYRGPAVVLAIDRRVEVSAEPRNDTKICITTPDIGISGYYEGQRYYPVSGGETGSQHLRPILAACRSVMDLLQIESGLDLRVNSDLPMAVGLGSSAALSVAVVAALDAVWDGKLSVERIVELSMPSERIVHGTPSGIDNTIAAFGGGLVYELPRRVERLPDLDEVPLVLGNTGVRRSTGKLVAWVKNFKERNSSVEKVIDAIAYVAEQGRDALLEADMKRVGELMSMNHGLLWALGVSTPDLDRLVSSSLRAGAYGAKLTGAGGGGCMVAVSTKARQAAVSKAIERSGGYPLSVKTSKKGLLVQKEP